MPRSAGSATVKLFVLDTNVILHDSNCIANFEEHDIAIPITVIEELDKFKKGHEDVHFHARAFLRHLDELTGDLLADGGASLGAGRGRIRVVIGGPWDPRLAEALQTDSPDHRILNAALLLQQREPGRHVALVSKDTNLRIKARSLGLPAEDYTSDKVESFDKLYAGKRTISSLPGDLIDAFYGEASSIPPDALPQVSRPLANENFILRNGSKSVLATYRTKPEGFVRVEKLTAYGIAPRNAEQAFALAALVNPDINLVTLAGKAGSVEMISGLDLSGKDFLRPSNDIAVHPIISLNERGDRLVEAMMDEPIQRIAWSDHDFRSGLVGVTNDPAVVNLSSMPETSDSVISLPAPKARHRTVQALGTN